MTGQFAAIVLKHDPVATAKVACMIEAANDDDCLDNDPAYHAWMDEQAETENMRHARW